MPGICDGKLTLFKSGALPALGRFATAAWSPICDASYLKWAASESMNLQKSNRRTPGWSLRHPQDGDGGLSVVLPGGRRIEVGTGFDGATLQRLILVLERM